MAFIAPTLRRRLLCIAVALAATLPPGATTLHAEPLSFDAALGLALREAPALTAATAREQAARSAAIPAGALPDPGLAVGLDNVPIGGPDRYSLSNDFMTMRRIGVMQEIPNRAKREARVDAAQARIAEAQAQERIARIGILRETAVAWIARHTTERQLQRINALRDENRLLAQAVNARLAGGQGSAADALLPRQEAAEIDARADEVEEQRQRAIAQLRRWIGEAADAPLAGTVPEWTITTESVASGLHKHPELIAFTSRAAALDAEVAAARAERRPDWAVGLAYQQRGAPYSDMVSLEFRVGLPVFTRTRQDPLVAARLAERESLEAEREEMVREHAADLAGDFAGYQRLSRAVERQRGTLLPLAEERIALALAAWRAGGGSLVELVAARRERIDAESRLIELEGERMQLAARLHYTVEDISGEQP